MKILKIINNINFSNEARNSDSSRLQPSASPMLGEPSEESPNGGGEEKEEDVADDCAGSIAMCLYPLNLPARPDLMCI